MLVKQFLYDDMSIKRSAYHPVTTFVSPVRQNVKVNSLRRLIIPTLYRIGQFDHIRDCVGLE